MSTGHVVVGPQRHGVVRFAEDLLASLANPGPVVRVAGPADLGQGWAAALRGAGRVHLQYTDALYALRCEEAGDVFAGLVATLRAAGLSPSVTLHDLPQPADGAALHRRRAAVYRQVVAACDQVVVSSGHEAALLAAIDPAPVPVTVIGLPVPAPVLPAAPPPGDGQATVLGFVHPGKGHHDVLAALGALAPEHGMTVLGGAAPGHDDLVDELVATGATTGRAVRVTGFVPEAELAARLHAAGVPVAAHRGVSASGSINTWLTAGRRPLVPEGRHARELQERNPGSVRTYPAGGLATALAEALEHPERTWLDPGTRLHPSPAEVADAHARLWARAVR